MRWSPFLEAFGFYALVAVAIWAGQSLGLKGEVWIGAVLLYGAAALSGWRHGDSAEKRGFAGKWFKPAVQQTLRWTGPVLLVLFVFALTRPAPPLPKLIFGLLGYPIWALAQEYALLSFAANRIRESLGDYPWRVAWVNGVLFSAIHAPNPMLMGACLIAGVAFTRLFLKTPHLVPIALAHALGGFLLSWIFLAQKNAMMVGPGYWKWG